MDARLPERRARPAPDPSRLDAVVRGRVQGVGYRFFVLAEARRLGLTGWVCNEPDGSVRCVAEGPHGTLDDFLTLLGDGPPGAWVERVLTTWGPAAGQWDRFEIRSWAHSGD